MTCYVVYAVLMGFQSIGVTDTWDRSKFAEFGNAMAAMADVNSKVINTASHIHCMAKCIYKPNCVFFSSNHVPEDKTTSSVPYKCILVKSAGNKSEEHEILNTCEKKSGYILMYPKRIGGACSDHKCHEGKKCSPRDEGGYKCKRESGRRRHG